MTTKSIAVWVFLLLLAGGCAAGTQTDSRSQSPQTVPEREGGGGGY